MRSNIMQNGYGRPSDIDPVSKVIAATLLVFALLIGAYAVIYYAAVNETSRAQLNASLPSNYRDTIKAMMAAAGHPCRQVCALTPAPGRTSLTVSCGVDGSATPCNLTRSYDLTIAPTPEASR